MGISIITVQTYPVYPRINFSSAVISPFFKAAASRFSLTKANPLTDIYTFFGRIAARYLKKIIKCVIILSWVSVFMRQPVSDNSTRAEKREYL